MHDGFVEKHGALTLRCDPRGSPFQTELLRDSLGDRGIETLDGASGNDEFRARLGMVAVLATGAGRS